MILTWLEGLNDWLPPHLLPDPDNLVVITAGKVSWQTQSIFICQESVYSDILQARPLASFDAKTLNEDILIFPSDIACI